MDPTATDDDPFFDEDPEGGYGAERVPRVGDDEVEPLVGSRGSRGAGSGQAAKSGTGNALIAVSALAVALVVAVVVMAVYIAGRGVGGPGGGSSAPASREELIAIAETVKSSLDTKVNPCDDFYQYACGGWIASNKIPDDKSSWGRGFTVIADRVDGQVREILESDRPMITPYYRACLDNATSEDKGVEPARELFNEVGNGVRDLTSAVDTAGRLRAKGVGAFLGADVGADSKFPDKNIVDLGQGGLSLPSRNYYLEAKKAGTREAYKAHISRMMVLLKIANGTAANDTAARVLSFETELAKLHLPPAELRDPHKTYNKYKIANLTALAGKFPIKTFLAAAKFPTDDSLDANVDVPAYLTELGNLLARSEVSDLKAYLTWHAARAVSGLLTDEVRDESFRFYGRELQGAKKEQPAWKRCVAATSSAMSELVGREWKDKHFPGASKDRALDIVTNIISSLRQHVPTLSWMDAATKTSAREKLGQVSKMIGYPDQWRSYDALESKGISTTDHYGNAMKVRQFDYDDMISRLKKPVDRKRWDMRVEEVNAYYSPESNTMVFPGGIIQPSFFNLSFPDAMNYGGIGAVMGHELGHSVDDQGSQFDGKGAMRDWWTANSTAAFKGRTQCIVDQYSEFKIKDRHVNGTLTLGENLADNGGVKTAYRAYLRAAAVKNGEDLPLIEGISNQQLFWIAYAQSWCSIRRDGFAEMLLLTDPHSPPQYRVNGPLRNAIEFSDDWKCKKGSSMNPEKKCTVF